MKVMQIKNFETHDWLLNVHYAKRIPNIIYSFGLYVDEVLKGIVTYGMPASNSLCIGIAGEKNKHLVLELNRLCFVDNEKNWASFLVSKSLQMLPKPKIIVSYADSDMGHIGYVYQATNFIFTGTTKERTDQLALDGKHSRHSLGDKNIRCKRSAKHRYIYVCANKYQKKELMEQINYPNLPYPKGEIKKYEINHNPITQAVLI